MRQKSISSAYINASMQDHPENPEAVDIQLASDGSNILTATAKSGRNPSPLNTSIAFDHAVEMVILQYDEALRNLGDS